MCFQPYHAITRVIHLIEFRRGVDNGWWNVGGKIAKIGINARAYSKMSGGWMRKAGFAGLMS